MLIASSRVALYRLTMPPTATQNNRSGLTAALSAYVIWGLLPLYLLLVAQVPAFELVGWRIIWTVPICLMIVAWRRQGAEIIAALTDIRTLAWLFLSASLIGVNWLIYVWAIQNDAVLAASLGYYINPLLNVVLGTVFLSERLTKLQWLAVGIAALGVTILALGAISTLWVSLSLAFSFGIYGMVRKRIAVGALPGLTIEALLLFLPAAGIAAFYAASPQGSSFDDSLFLGTALALGGVVTAIPLLLFAIAARRMAYSTLGFIQFLAPSIVFVLGLTVFDEPLLRIQLICFMCIWIAAAIFIFDLWQRHQTERA